MKLIVTDFAEDSLAELGRWLLFKYGPETAYNVLLAAQKTIVRIGQNTYHFPVEYRKDGKAFRKAVVHKRTIIAFTIDEVEGIIYVIDAFDSRTDWK